MRKVTHIFQRGAEGMVIFYTLHDYLVYYTIFSTYAKRMGLQVLGLAIMYNHLHILVVSGDKRLIRRFMTVISSVFAREYNNDIGIDGDVFQRPYGASTKYGEKEIRTICGYLYNNHTNGKLCHKAEEIRWNFLAYAHNDHPFSEKIPLKKARMAYRRAVKMVQAAHSRGDYLRYAALRRIFRGLTKNERESITDYIVQVYNIIDYKALESLYSSYEEMVYSFNANVHHDYDIPESDEDRKGDFRAYQILSRLVTESKMVSGLKQILLLSEDERIMLALRCQAETGLPLKQVSAFFHVKIDFDRIKEGMI
ncbi:MAG: transposase [Bacteroidales bacterium]|nr:transposase [Bacteroidales bacterium]